MEAQRRSLRQLNQRLAREAADTSVDSGVRFERIATLQREIEAVGRRLVELTDEREDLDRDQISAEDLRGTLAKFDAVWSTLNTKEQERMIQLLVSKVGYDGRTARVTVNFSNAGAKETMPRKAMITPPESTGSDGTSVQFEVTLPEHQRARKVPHQTQPSQVAPRHSPPRIPRITRLMALAIKFQDMVDRGEVKDYADLARLGHVTRARLTQIMNLLLLAPDIQEELLAATTLKPQGITAHERTTRAVVRMPLWSDQRRVWGRLENQTRR